MALTNWFKIRRQSKQQEQEGIFASDQQMFRSMKLQFIALASLAVFGILFSVIGILNTARYVQVRTQISSVLTAIDDNDGSLMANIEISRGLGETITLSSDSLYSYRYFSALVDADGQVLSYNSEAIAELTDQQVEAYAAELASARKVRGDFLHRGVTYSYLKTVEEDKTYRITVLDSTIFYDDVKALVHLSVWMGTTSFLIFLVIITGIATRVMGPFIKNHQKQRRFITNAGHELKTPLSIISANNELVEMMTGESEWTRSTADQVTRLTGLINGMVSLARLEEQSQVQLTELDFSAICQDAAEDFKGPVLRGGKSFELTIQPGILVKAEERSLFELVTLLVDNANKYCDPEGQVTVSLRQVGSVRKRARLDISNTYAKGAGVDYSRFFERFYREDESHNSENQGCGIGLSTAQSIVTIFKGKIMPSYRDGTFTMTVIL